LVVESSIDLFNSSNTIPALIESIFTNSSYKASADFYDNLNPVAVRVKSKSIFGNIFFNDSISTLDKVPPIPFFIKLVIF
jgi:hypothetical protein